MMFFKKKRENKMIFPLSPNAELDNRDLVGLEVYQQYLATAFNEPRIKNIVLTGDFGIGKSSVLRSFEKEYCKKMNIHHVPTIYVFKNYVQRKCYDREYNYLKNFIMKI